ncbi:substrate-binding domain-containing protein [Salidesulfovibrio onnuriiensis]|uniref:substrate-binding domain-containing protein n=1 Tax=Salidesulfovibrio onnuriiensis TaxID=2583823 RepID=UPI0011CA5CD2|nr:substrate-binding domain-containing protein [Salidesulfovibrio onnuriiensis]
MKHVFSLLLACLALCVSLPAMAERAKILVIPKGVRVKYWQWVEQGAKRAGHDRDVEIIFRGPWASDDFVAQFGILKAGIEEGVDAIVIAPNHTSYSAELLEQAVQKGIKVVLIDSDMEFEDRVSLVASDNHFAGKQAAEHLISLMGGKGTALLLHYAKDNASTMAREKGFLDAASERGSCLTVVEAEEAGVSAGTAYYATMEAFVSNPYISGIFSPGESTTIGALRALRDMHLNGTVKLVGFDFTREIHEALVEGSLNGTVLQSPYQIGYLGVMAACDALEGKPVEKRIVTKTTVVVDPENMFREVEALSGQ